MSADFERRLRDARQMLPDPEPATTEHARERALRATRRRRPRARIAALVGVALGVTLGVGIGLGSLVAPSVTASDGPAGLGFLPEEGWYVQQAGTDATPERPAVAIASNVALSPGDGASIVPYETLLRLPADGIVIVANFTGRIELATAHYPRGLVRFPAFPEREMPLRMSEAVPLQQGGQIRPEEPLGRYQLEAEVNGYAVGLHFYFGVPEPSAEMLAAAQRQLARLVVRANEQRRPAAATSAATSAATVVDRTFVCATQQNGGIYEVEARAHSGVRESGSRWKTLPFAVAATGNTGTSMSRLDNSLAWITAARPSTATIIEEGDLPLAVLSLGTVAVNLRQCRAVNARAPPTSAGLRGGTAGQLGEIVDCETQRRVLVRVRARLQSGDLRESRGFLRSTGPVADATLAVRTQTGRPLVYATVAASGKARLFTAPRCVPD